MVRIDIARLGAGSADLQAVAQWRVGAFAVLGRTVEAEAQSLTAFLAAADPSVALIARCDGVLAGTCLLVPREIEAAHDVSPWLAGLFVAPEFRGSGVGRALVRAIEAHGQSVGLRACTSIPTMPPRSIAASVGD